jgi:hypothetical protein
MPSLEAQIRAVRNMRQAAMNLSAACVENLRIPADAAPLVKVYDKTILEQDASPEMTLLLRRIQ